MVTSNINYFDGFKIGTLFLIRTPETFSANYAERALADMAELGIDYISWLETWNCTDGIIWKSDAFPRSSYWKGESRDPLEETFAAAAKNGIAFFPEAGYMHQVFFDSHPAAWCHDHNDNPAHRYSRIGLVPDAPETLDYFIMKYETLIEKYQHYDSLKGVCLPSENSIHLSYDQYTQEAYKKIFSCKLPTPEEIESSQTLYENWQEFSIDRLVNFFTQLGHHIKAKYSLSLMHYPLGLLSGSCHFQPTSYARPSKQLSALMKVKDTDLFNIQIHPTLDDNPYYFKAESEIIQELCGDRKCISDTHFYHEFCDGELPSATPKRFKDWTLSTLTPSGISYFSYGFFAPELPLWKDEINPGAPVYNGYSLPETVGARRKGTQEALLLSKQLGRFIKNSRHEAECAIYYNEKIRFDYPHSSYEKEHLFGLYEVFQAAAIPVTFAATIPEPSSKIKLLLLHYVRNLSAGSIAKLNIYMAGGGNVLLSGVIPSELQNVFKLNINQTSAHYVKKTTAANTGSDLMFSCPLDTLKFNETSGKPLAFWSDNSPAVTEKSIGKGKLIYIGASSAFSIFSHHRNTPLINFFKSLIIQLNEVLEVELKCRYRLKNYHRYLSTDIYRKKNENNAVLIIRNFGVEAKNVMIKWHIADAKQVEIFTDGQQLASYNWENNTLSVTIPVIEDIAFISASF